MIGRSTYFQGGGTAEIERRIKVIGIVAAGIAGAYAFSMLEKLRTRRRTESRENVPPDRIYVDYYKTSGLPCELFLRNWTAISRCLEVSAGKLRSEDRLEDFSAPRWMGSDGFTPVDVLYAEISRRSAESSTARLETVDDVVRLLVREGIDLSGRDGDR